MKIKYQNLTLSYSFIKHVFKQLSLGKTPVRIFHNYFLKDLEIYGKVIDIGSGNHSSYLSFIKQNNTEIFFADKFHIKQKNFIKVDLEKNIEIESQIFDTVLLFNVLEHVNNYKNLLKEIGRIVKKDGKFEIFVPFMQQINTMR